MKLTNLIKTLGSFEPNGYPFLSIYLNAEADNNGRDQFQIWLKKPLSDQGQPYKDNPEELERYEAVVEKINAFINDEVDASANGIAIFASLGDDGFFEAVQLAVPFPENNFFSYDRPHVFPLARALDQNPKYAVLWADTNKADIYVFGGENRIRSDNQADDKVENIQNTVTNRSQVGGWSQGRYQRHIENFHLQHAKEVVAELEELVSKKNIEMLILCGDETTIMPILRPQLSKAVDEKVIATMNMSQYDSAEEIHERTKEVLGMENATRDQKKVEDLNNAAKAAAGLGTLGLEDTLRALANGQVRELVISADIDAIEYSKTEVENIFEEYRPGDDNAPVDVPPMVQIAGEVADQLILRAINTDAKITFIEDSSILQEAGGVGAILRYNMNATANGSSGGSRNNEKGEGIMSAAGKKKSPQHDEQPKSPMLAQKQSRPGIEAEMDPKPEYLAPNYKGSEKLLDKAAIITGGDSGIGRSVAVLFAREGADVAIVHLPAEKRDAAETAAAVEREGRKCITIAGDVKDPKFCKRAVDKARKEFGRLDVLVNNAAFQKHQTSVEDITDEQFEETFRTNIFGYFYMAKAALKHLPEGGAIVNCGSITGLEGNKELIDYSATKGAIHAFTKSLAQSLVERKIRVNCVSPGPVWTPLNVADKEPEDVANHGAGTPMKRPAQPEEIAPAFVFFASDADSSYISGEILTLLGGETRAA